MTASGDYAYSLTFSPSKANEGYIIQNSVQGGVAGSSILQSTLTLDNVFTALSINQITIQIVSSGIDVYINGNALSKNSNIQWG